MENMSPQQRHECLNRSRALPATDSGNKRRMKSQSHRRQSAPSLVITKALTRSKTLSRESSQVPACPETCTLVQSYLACPKRSFLLHGHAQLKTGLQTQERHLFLFNDMLVITKAKAVNHFKQKAQVWLCEMWMAGCMEEVCEGSTAPERGFVMGWPTCNCVATFSSSEQKEKWLTLLKSQIKEEKEREQPKTIPLNVYGKGISTFALGSSLPPHTKTLPVSNLDSTNEVIRLGLQQFGIAGKVKDYQLWVISKRDNTPYPLIGHEFPFSIYLNHMRDSPSTNRDAGTSSDRQRALQPEQPPMGKQCQFVLKLRPVTATTARASTESTQKPFKRSRSLISWAFWRGSSPQLNDSYTNLCHRGPGCLFGQPLSSLCVEESLPKPVMDMLFFLYHEGSMTRGIFRRSAGARAVRELRDSLDAGLCELPLTRDHVFIIAGVFKDFLRHIPGSLLRSELYDEWTEVLEEDLEEGETEEGETERERVQDIQRLIGRLPKENSLLLHYVAALLHGIQGNARHNQMTSFNLSVCIAPSMLWAPGPCSPEQEGQGAKMVCDLVRFMIDHCQQILGHELNSVFGGPPQRHSNEDLASDPMTDSSYDSLENELDDNSSGDSLALSADAGRRRLRPKPLQGSLDSILTLSDYDQDADPDVRVGPLASTRIVRGSRGGLSRARPKHLTPSGSDPAGPDTSSPEGNCRTQRRRSEPAYMARFTPCVAEIAEEGLVDVDHRVSLDCRLDDLLPATGSPAPEASPSSLSSHAAFPVLTHSPLEVLHSLGSDLASQAASAPTSCALTPVAAVSPRELLSWGKLKGSRRGLHPNSWLKKARRLSLTQQDNLEKEEGEAEDRPTKGLFDKSHPTGKPVVEKEGPGEGARGRKRLPNEFPGSKLSTTTPSHHRSTGSLQSPSSVLPLDLQQLAATHPKASQQHTPSAALSLFRRHRSPACRQHRWSSEPELQQDVDRTTALHLERPHREAGRESHHRLPSDLGLKVPEMDSAASMEPRFCLSPCATKAVREYFESHRCGKHQSSQQGALALMKGKTQWRRTRSHSSLVAEPEFEQLLFPEESYV